MRSVLLCALMATCAQSAWGSFAPSVEVLVAQLTARHPEALAAQSRTDRALGRQQIADAAFDLRVTQSTNIRPSGYYDGRVADQRLVQPLKPFNAEVFSGYRLSDGTFPVYEQELQTLDAGELSLGVRLSLLQNRDTDPRRLALENAAWRYQEAASSQLLDVNKLLYRGVSAWLDWYQSTLKRGVVTSLLLLTQDRLAAIQQRVESGDLAAITLTEYRTTLTQRQILAQEAERIEVQAQEQLKYFLTPTNGPESADTGKLTAPADIAWPFRVVTHHTQEAWSAEIEQHPALLALTAKAKQLNVDERIARNELLPELDLEMKVAQDFGTGPEALDGTESIIALSFEVPLGVRAAKGRVAMAAAATREVEYRYQVLAAQLLRDLQVSLTALAFNEKILVSSEEQEVLALELLAQEQIRFKEGESTQFVLISREKVALEAQLKRIDATIDRFRNELIVHATLAKLAG